VRRRAVAHPVANVDGSDWVPSDSSARRRLMHTHTRIPPPTFHTLSSSAHFSLERARVGEVRRRVHYTRRGCASHGSSVSPMESRGGKSTHRRPPWELVHISRQCNIPQRITAPAPLLPPPPPTPERLHREDGSGDTGQSGAIGKGLAW
jgi:hypothetical protein